MKLTLGQLCGLILILLSPVPSVVAQELSVASPTPLVGEVLLTQLDESSRDWRVRAMRISVHEQMFRTGWKVVFEPQGFWKSTVLNEEMRTLASVPPDMEDFTKSLSAKARLAHLHQAILLLNHDWSSFPVDREAGNQLLFFTSMASARLYDQGAPYILDAQLQHGSVGEPTTRSEVFHQDLYALFQLPSMRGLAEKSMKKLWISDLVCVAKLCTEDDEELLSALKDAAAVRALAEASDMYASAVLIGDNLVGDLKEPWQSPCWRVTKEAATLWFDLEERRRQVDELYKGPEREVESRMKEWREASNPREKGR